MSHSSLHGSDVFVSVLMPVYNGAKYISETVNSILKQSHLNFEFIIVDDCSVDNSYAILEQYSQKDKRIKLHTTECNHGNPGGVSAIAINLASKHSKYIIMTDQDDLSCKDRLAVQIRFMENHPTIDISGSRMKMFGNKSRISKPPKYDHAIKARLLTSSPIPNPTIIFRKSFLDERCLNYKNQTSHDYQLLAEAAIEHRAVFHNLQEVLVHYRCHSNQTSFKIRQAIQKTSNMVREYQLRKLGISSAREILFFNRWKAREIETTTENVNNLKDIFEKIIQRNTILNIYPKEALLKRLTYLYRKELIRKKSFIQCFFNSHLGRG